jgi:circadian clock protein KaiB
MTYKLRLFVTGQTGHSAQAIQNLKRLCKEELGGDCEVDVVDVLESPHLAEESKILATPTLVKDLPPPLRKIIGDLSDKDKVLLGLDLYSASEHPAGEEETR